MVEGRGWVEALKFLFFDMFLWFYFRLWRYGWFIIKFFWDAKHYRTHQENMVA